MMASAFLIERLKDGKPRGDTIILSKSYPCKAIPLAEQSLLKAVTGSSFAVARRMLVWELEQQDPAKAARLQKAIDLAVEQGQSNGRGEPAMVEVGLIKLSPRKRAADGVA
jgi:hypothetical protein